MLIVAGQQPRAETVPGLHMCEGKNELTAEVTGKNSTRGSIWWMALWSLCTSVFVCRGCACVFECVHVYFMCQYVNASYCLLTLCVLRACVCVRV